MKNNRAKVYVNGRGIVDIARNAFFTLAKSAATKAAEVGGEKLGSFAATKLSEKVLPHRPTEATIRAIEDLENKIKRDIENYSGKGKGFKLIK